MSADDILSWTVTIGFAVLAIAAMFSGAWAVAFVAAAISLCSVAMAWLL